jgi:DNA mismatch repair protein MutS
LPEAVVERAREVLRQLEEGEVAGRASRLVDDLPLFSAGARRRTEGERKGGALADALAGLDPDEMTPRQALEALYRLKAML